jgi:hypothetical protein
MIAEAGGLVELRELRDGCSYIRGGNGGGEFLRCL